MTSLLKWRVHQLGKFVTEDKKFDRNQIRNPDFISQGISPAFTAICITIVVAIISLLN
jgi:hypothetical protein